MKRSLLLFFVSLTLVFSACDNDDVTPQDCFEVKVVRRYCTGAAVLQIVTPAAQSFGETWTNSRDTTYENVFHTMLPCGFDYDAFGNGETFSIRLADSEDNTVTCFRCLMVVGGLPETFSHIRVANDCNSTGE